MNHFFHSLSVGLYGALCLFFLAAALPVHAAEKTGDVGLKTLSAQAAQLQQRLDQNPSDYEALQGIGITCQAKAETLRKEE